MFSPNGINRLPDEAMLLKISLLFLNKIICCGYSKVFQSYKHMFKVMDKIKNHNFRNKIRSSCHMINLFSDVEAIIDLLLASKP